jgi:hypothetical protein
MHMLKYLIKAEFFSKAYTHCKKFEDSKDIGNLAMKLFGSAEDKKLASMVAEWMKGKKYDFSPKKSVKVEPEKENVNLLSKNYTCEKPHNFGISHILNQITSIVSKYSVTNPS